MTQTRKTLLTLLTALTLSACQPAEPAPINPTSTASFGIHAILHAADGTPASNLPDRYVLGEDVVLFGSRDLMPLYVMQPATIGTACLQSIREEQSSYGEPVLHFSLTPECAETFGRMTARSIGKRMAVLINGELVTAPYIRSAITGGSGSIDGGFESLSEAEAIARQFY